VEVALRRLLRQAAARADRQRRAPGSLSARVKLVYFVPEEARDATREAVVAAGGGVIGDYERCSWYTSGTGTFFARTGAQPATGEVGQEERTSECRVEIVVPEDALPAAVAALRRAHPYEEVALDVYPLVDVT
jgi:hypothetical protein